MKQTLEPDTIKEKMVDFYNSEVSNYCQRNYVKGSIYSALQFRQHYIEQMIDKLTLSDSAKILDVGCGPGELMLSLLHKGYRHVQGIDISVEMTKKANQLLHSYGLSSRANAVVGDIENIQYDDETFDVVVAAGVLEYQKEDSKSLSEMKRVLKKGGYLILNVTNKYGYLNYILNLSRWLKKRRFVGTYLRSLFPSYEGAVIKNLETRQHSPKKFDKLLEQYGFQKINFHYFHFGPLPTPLTYVSFLRKIGKRMESLSTKSFSRFLSGGYLVMVKKEE